MAEYHLPHEVMTEILSRLPAKSLCKFKCVSKSVLNLTLDSNFAKLHLNRAIQRDNREIIVKRIKKSDHGKDGKEGTFEELFAQSEIYIVACYRSFIYCVDVDAGFHEIDVSFGDYNCMHALFGSCNGILCLANKYQICLLNPCTMEYRVLKHEMDNICFVRDAVYGFGYDEFEEIYKLVRVDKRGDCESEIRVYSLLDDDISCLKVSNVPYQIPTENSLGVFLNGAFHWVGQHKTECAERIISFDVGSTLVFEFSRPDRNEFMLKGHPGCITLGLVEGDLALFRRDDTDVVIWVMQVYGVPDSWCKLFYVKKDECWIPRSGLSCFNDLGLRPLHFTKNAQVLINKDETVVMYDLKRKAARDLDLRTILDWYHKDIIVVHVPSLVSLKSGTYLGTSTRDEEKEKAKGSHFSFRS